MEHRMPAHASKLHKLTLKIRYLPISEICDSPRNARTHDEKQIAKLAASIQAFGFVSPVLIDERNTLLCGHCRVVGALRAGFKRIPTVQVCHLTEAQKRALAIIDNRLTEFASWDANLLRHELEFLSTSEVTFDLSMLEFDTNLDLRLDPLAPKRKTRAALGARRIMEPAISAVGDVWALGGNLLYIGHALSADTIIRHWQEVTGEAAINARTGETFTDREATSTGSRSAPSAPRKWLSKPGRPHQ